MAITKTPEELKTDIQAVTTITVSDTLIANTDSIVKKQIADLKTILTNTMDRLVELEARVTALEPIG